MSDLVSVARGRRPWEPAPGVRLHEVFNTYDGPLLGVIEEDGVPYLFDCIYGHVESLSVWLYSRVPKPSLPVLERLEGDKFNEMVRKIQMRSPGRLALVVDGEGIVASADAVDFPNDLSNALEELVRDHRQTAERFRNTEGEVEDLESTARRGLVPA
jgi:hypothetical protein